MSALKPESKLEYSLTETPPVIVVALNGVINGATIKSLEACRDEILKRLQEHNTKFVILDFQQVAKLDGAGIPSMQRFKKAIKDGHGIARLCRVSSELRAVLLSGGIFGLGDMSDSVEAAIRGFQSTKNP